jgi:hypothetical protein
MSSQESAPKSGFFRGWEGDPQSDKLIRLYEEAAEGLPEDATYEDLVKAMEEIKQRWSEEAQDD